MSDNQSKGIVPQKSGDKSLKNSSLAKRGLQTVQKIFTQDSFTRNKLEEIPEFYSVPNFGQGISSDGDFENHKINVLYVGELNSQFQQCVAYINSNASVILFPINSIESIAAKMIWDNVQKAGEQY